jgi:hypothetical protein
VLGASTGYALTLLVALPFATRIYETKRHQHRSEALLAASSSHA